MPEHLVEERRVLGLAELGRVFLGDDGIIRERLGQRTTDQGLAAEIGDRHRALVLLGQDLRRDLRRHGPAQPRRLPHRTDRNLSLTFVQVLMSFPASENVPTLSYG